MTAKIHEIRLDKTKRLAEQPGKGHNRWHPAIPPALRVEPGDEVIVETVDAFDGYITWDSGHEDAATFDFHLAHTLTGPIWVNGAEEGDLLEVQILEAIPADFGWTAQSPGFGFLRDLFPEPFLVRWKLANGYAESPDLPGIRISEASFPGVLGVAPSLVQVERIITRERATVERGGFALLPDPRSAFPADEPIASQGLRTIPPRENGGNLDVKQLTRGTTVWFPVFAPGGLLSIGDPHFAQGDGEVCGTAIEMAGAFHLRLGLHKGAARTRGIRGTQFAGEGELAAPRRYYATTGLSMRGEEIQEAEDATLAARNALLAMIAHLQERGFTRQQAYALCSVAVDLRVSEVVDVPNFVVTAFLPLDIFIS
jgi:formamidase